MHPDRVVLTQEAVRAIRPAADAFAEAVVAGARQLSARGPDGRLTFRSPEVEERHEALRAALRAHLPQELTATVEGGGDAGWDRFLDQLVRGWLQAETDITHFVIADRRGDGRFVFDLLRAELRAAGVELVVEPRPRGELLISPRSRWQVAAPVVGCVWLGAFAGFLIELAGVGGAAAIGFAVGLGAGLLLGLRLLLRAPTADCSECGETLAVTSERCASCGTSFLDEGDGREPPRERGRGDG